MRNGPLTRLPAGVKLAGLAVAGTGAMLLADWRPLAVALAAVLALHGLARVPGRRTLAPLAATAPILAVILLAQGLAGDWPAGVAAALRLAAMVALADLVTLTTRQSAMTTAISRALSPLRRLGLRPEGLALAVALALRFMPLIAAEAALVRDAQRARGLERRPLAFLVPLVVRVLKMADEVGEAIAARGGEGERQARAKRG